MPVLLTDFDGVIAPFGRYRKDVTVVTPGGWLDSATVLNGLPEALHRLHKSGRARWVMLSSWGAEVTGYLEPYGLGHIEALVPGTVGGALRDLHGKAAAVEAFLAAGETVIWCDDLDIASFRDECPAEAEVLLAHPRLLLIEPESHVGLTPEHLLQAVAFASA